MLSVDRLTKWRTMSGSGSSGSGGGLWPAPRREAAPSTRHFGHIALRQARAPPQPGLESSIDSSCVLNIGCYACLWLMFSYTAVADQPRPARSRPWFVSRSRPPACNRSTRDTSGPSGRPAKCRRHGPWQPDRRRGHRRTRTTNSLKVGASKASCNRPVPSAAPPRIATFAGRDSPRRPARGPIVAR